MLSDSAMSNTTEVFDNPHVAGQKLRIVREALGLSTEAVELQLRLQPGYIDAFELAEWDKLPSAVFLRGYLAAYCKLLNTDVLQYLPAYESVWRERIVRGKSSLKLNSSNTTENPPKLHALEASTAKAVTGESKQQLTGEANTGAKPLFAIDAEPDYQAPSLHWHVLAVFLLSALVVLASFWEPVSGGWRNLTQKLQPLGPYNLDQGLYEGLDQRIHSINDAAFEEELNALLLDGSPNPAFAPAVVLTPLGQKNTWLVGQSSEMQQDTLEVYFVRETNIEVRDSKGLEGANEHHASGALIKIGGDAPFTIVVDDPSAVMVKFNQLPVDLLSDSFVENVTHD